MGPAFVRHALGLSDRATQPGRRLLAVGSIIKMSGPGGALLVALSLGRPVLVPRSSTTEQIAAEVGARWVHLFDGPLTAAALLQAIAGAAVAQGAGEPDLRLRDWDSVGRQHADAYGKAIALRRSR